MQLSRMASLSSAVFDEPSLVSSAGLVPVLSLADRAGLRALVDEQLTVPSDKGANAGSKVAALVAGMVAGADSIEDMGLLRHGGMGRLFTGLYAPSTLGSFLRGFAFGHVPQLDAVAARLVANLATHAPLLSAAARIAFADGELLAVHVKGDQQPATGAQHPRKLAAGDRPLILSQMDD